MKRALFGIGAFALLTLTQPTFGAGFDCQPLATPTWNRLADGVEWTQFDLAFSPYLKEQKTFDASRSRQVSVRALRVDVSKAQLAFHHQPSKIACDPTKDRYANLLAKDFNRELPVDRQVIATINASFFVMPGGDILGLALDERRTWSLNLAALAKESSGIFGFENGTPFLARKSEWITRFGSSMSTGDAGRYSFALQAYPRLLLEGELQVIDDVKVDKRPRTSIGVAEKPNEVLLVTIDAHGESSKTGMSLYEYAYFLKTPQCGVGQKMVLNLDGGGSSAFVVPSLGIAEQADRCRQLGNILAVLPR